jgi:hypothetical protein
MEQIQTMMWLVAWSIHRRGRGRIPREERVKILGTVLMLCLQVFQTSPCDLATSQPAIASMAPRPFMISASGVNGPHERDSPSL